MSSTLIEIKKTNEIATLVLNDAEKRNAMSTRMAEEFVAQVTLLREDKSIRVVILRGAGKAFSGGGDLDMLFEKIKITPPENKRLMELFYDQFLSIRTLEVPVIAALNGHAIGAGLCLACACDLRIATQSAKLGLNFVHLGLHPGMGATYFIPRLVGPAKAAELLYCGKIITAEEAKQIGLVNQVVSDGEFETCVSEVARTIATAGPQAVRELKKSLQLSSQLALEDCLRREASCQALDYAGAEFKEGIQAAKEKRSPRFS